MLSVSKEKVNCKPFTLSARIARLSLRAKNPDTGPVWWYLKHRADLIKCHSNTKPQFYRLTWVFQSTKNPERFWPLSNRSSTTPVGTRSTWLLVGCSRLTVWQVCHHNPSSWTNVSCRRGRILVWFSCWTSCGCQGWTETQRVCRFNNFLFLK